MDVPVARPERPLVPVPLARGRSADRRHRLATGGRPRHPPGGGSPPTRRHDGTPASPSDAEQLRHQWRAFTARGTRPPPGETAAWLGCAPCCVPAPGGRPEDRGAPPAPAALPSRPPRRRPLLGGRRIAWTPPPRVRSRAAIGASRQRRLPGLDGYIKSVERRPLTCPTCLPIAGGLGIGHAQPGGVSRRLVQPASPGPGAARRPVSTTSTTAISRRPEGPQAAGTVTAADLRPRGRGRSRSAHRGVRVTTHPQNSSGLVALEILSILASSARPHAFGPAGDTDPGWIHLGIEASKLRGRRDGTSPTRGGRPGSPPVGRPHAGRAHRSDGQLRRRPQIRVAAGHLPRGG
jgi:hypothetical protein